VTAQAELVDRLPINGAGPVRPLPDRRAHEIFEDWVRRTPDAVAAVHGTRRVTYAELNAAATVVAAALQAAGVQPEDMVAVVADRSIDWLAAIIGIFKAGGAYLPVDPAYPAERVEALVRRSDCRTVLVDAPGLAVTATVAAAGAIALPITPATPPRPFQPPAIHGGSLAYVYFTSGSTGAPKGAMCEHDGMLNHLLAKVETFHLEPGVVVAQTASQCFDISLWQAYAPLLAGGSTLIVDPELMLDVPRLLDRLEAERVAVLQLVPSYLDVLVTDLEQRGYRPSTLRMVGVTGEAVSQRVLARWFRACPDIPVVNAYGATEASDDTTHEIIVGTPGGELVPVGLAIPNVFVDVLDEQGRPVGDDSIGEIAFSGVCVGRGYINDLDRTKAAFEPDPVRPGLRRYRTGDYGQWLPDGRLAFLGRRDQQVKISGMRVEVGEVENHLLRVPGVRTACVVVVPDGASKRLAGFYTAQSPIPDLADQLATRIPRAIVPKTLRHRPELPLTSNGKVDRRALLDLEIGGAGTGNVAPPLTPTEQRLATAWAEVLGLPLDEIGRDDHFFDRGGGSLAGVRLVVNLGGVISLADLTTNPVLADLAAVIDAGRETAASLLQRLSGPGTVRGALVCLPYEAGNALNFQAVARALAGSGIGVYAVEPAGHDVSRPDEPLAGVAETARRLGDEIGATIDVPVALWGHGCGGALALATAAVLGNAGTPAVHVFLAVALTGGDDTTDAHVWLRDAAALTDVDETGTGRAALVDRAYRHDLAAAAAWLASAPPTVASPVTLIEVPAAPGEGDVGRTYARIPARRLAAPAGRYFVRSHPDEVAALVKSTMDGTA
jgi:amino acid adenylation domain-containing protein